MIATGFFHAVSGIHTGFSAKGGETGGRVGWAAIVEWLSLET